MELAGSSPQVTPNDESADKKRRSIWLVPLSVAAITSAVLLPLVVYSPYADIPYILLITPFVCLILATLLVIAAIRKKKRSLLAFFLALIAFLAVSGTILWNEEGLRASLRWLFWSRRFKSELLLQPIPTNGELRHMEWDATGFAGVANNTVYLVFDPTDRLSAGANSHSSGKFSGIPCEVLRVRRLENSWYAVWFYTDEAWGERNQLDCTWQAN